MPKAHLVNTREYTWVNDPKVTQLQCALDVGGIGVSFQELLANFVLLDIYFADVYLGMSICGLYLCFVKKKFKQRKRCCVKFCNYYRSRLEAVSKRRSCL